MKKINRQFETRDIIVRRLMQVSRVPLSAWTKEIRGGKRLELRRRLRNLGKGNAQGGRQVQRGKRSPMDQEDGEDLLQVAYDDR